MPHSKERDLYFVAVKLFLEHKGKLFIFKDKYGDWDLPGGRIRKSEFTAPLELVMARKMKEELGSGTKYLLGKPVVFFRHERREAELGKRVRIFAIGYRGAYLGGALRLSELHTEFLWVPIKSFRPERYFTGGWLRGVREYLELRRKRT